MSRQWTKMQNLVIFGQKILFFTGDIKSFVTHITKNPPRHLDRIVFWLGIGQNVQKMAIFGPKWPKMQTVRVIIKWPRRTTDPVRAGITENRRFHVRPKSGFWPKNGSYPKKSPKMTFSPLIIWAKALFFFEQLFPVVARTWLGEKSDSFFLGPKFPKNPIFAIRPQFWSMTHF